MGKQEDEFFKNLSDSKYLDLVIKERVDETVSDISRKYRNYLRIIIGLGILILTFFGYESVNFYGKIQSLDNQIDHVKNLQENLHAKKETMIKEIDIKIKEIDLIKDSVDLKSKTVLSNISSKKKEIDDWFSNELENKIDDIDDALKRFSTFETNIKIDLDSLSKYKESISEKIEDIKEDVNRIRKNSSVRYLFVERGDRYSTDQFYRGKTLILPFTDNETLEIVFWGEPLSIENPKEISLDIVHNRERKSLNFRENVKHELISKDNLTYIVESVFIYMPPNAKTILGGLGPYYKMPDFVITKVYLKNNKLTLKSNKH